MLSHNITEICYQISPLIIRQTNNSALVCIGLQSQLTGQKWCFSASICDNISQMVSNRVTLTIYHQ